MKKTIADLRPSLVPVSRIPSASPRDTLDKAFSSLQSSHESVFIFDAAGGFLGLACPARSLFKTRATYQTATSSVLFQPPRISSGTPVSDIARFMLATRCYALPVGGKNGSVRGAITARGLLKAILREEEYPRILAETIAPERPVTLARNASAASVYARLRKSEVTRILLVSENGRLEGLVSRRDIQSHLTKPTSRQRIRTGGKGPARNFVWGTEKESRLDFPALSIASRNLLAVSDKTPMSETVSLLARSRRTSIILLEKNSIPTGIVSFRTILKAIADSEKAAAPPVSLYDGARLPEGDADHIRERLEQFAEKMKERLPLLRIDAFLKAPRNTSGRPLSFQITLEAIVDKRDSIIAHAEHRELLQSLFEAERKLERQIKDRS